MTVELGAALIGAVVGGFFVFLAMRSRLSPRVRDISDPLATVVNEETTTQRLVRTLPFAAFMFDGEGRLTFVNAAAETLFGIFAERAYGRALIEVVPSVDFERQVFEALRGQSSTRDVRVIDGDRERIFGITAQQLEPEGAIAIAVDRTALVSMERVRRDFVSNVSHELRTPLSAIKLMVETVLLSDDDAEARALFLPRVASEVDRMVHLVEDLLELARSESGRLVLRKETFDLTDVAAAVVNTFAQRASTIEVELDLEAPEAVYVEADRDRLTQVAMNLLDNALRHTPANGNVTIEVGSEGEFAVLRVRDTGIGIPHNDLTQIFERFYVVDRSRSRGHSGTGLGLSIARHLVEAHGGSIVAESVFGQGATFVCRLPLAVQP
ncbi:MAG TPA: ATP-binding protein [Caballeronia sp.]|nr:ATP-binding protein [Caballeronia sp.]